MVVILNFCLKVYYFIVISGRGGPHVGGHLFNPPTHRHKRGCLRTPTVLRIKFSKKKITLFPKATTSVFSSCPFKKIFQKNFHHFPKGHPYYFYNHLFKKKSKKFFIYFPEGSSFFYVSIFLFHFFYYRFIKNKISTTINFRNAYIRILYKFLYSFIIYLFAFIFDYFCIRR